MATRAAIQEFLRSGNALAGSTDPQSAGNGSLMRLAPVALMYGADTQKVQDMAALRQDFTLSNQPDADGLWLRLAALMDCSRQQALAI